MAQSESEKQIQLIDENQHFNSTLDLIKHWQLQDRGFDYHVVAVFGSQSTGKSTLLNLLFGTTFDVMNMTTGRSQTTKGIWMSRASEPSILVMDVEGTDGRERGEDQDFERKSALFSLATAEVVLINMWENSVGLYNGANMSLLRTVMEVNLQLFQQVSNTKTCLLFVLRDSTGVTPLETLAETLKADLHKIWASLSKPSGKESALITDYFEFAFSNAAHKIYATKQFEEDVSRLQKRFYDKTDPEFILKPKYHKGIPADGFPLFAKTIWSKILDNRDLDLPTQQQLLAQYRCDEIAKVVFDEMALRLKQIKPHLDAGEVVIQFGNTIAEAYDHALSSFDKDASRYHSDTYLKKQIEFKDKIHGHLHLYYLQQLRNLKALCITTFQTKFNDKLKAGDLDFNAKFDECKAVAIDEFTKQAQASKLLDCDWSYDEYLSGLRDDIEEYGSQKRTEALFRVSKAIEKKITKEIEEPIKMLIVNATPTLWQDVAQVQKDVLETTLTIINDKLTRIEEEELLENVSSAKFQAWEILIKTLSSEVSDGSLLEKLRRKFESHFKYDEKGLPRVWKPADDIDTLYSQAKQVTEELLVLFSKFTISLDELDQDIVKNQNFDSTSLVLIPSSKMQSIKERFGRESDGMFLEAKRATVASQSVIPPWFIVLTFALGWNELLTILRNPMLTISFVIAMSVSFFVWKTNMGGPAFQIAKATAFEAASQTKVFFKDKGLDVDRLKDLTNNITTTLNQVHTPKKTEQIELKELNETDKNK